MELLTILESGDVNDIIMGGNINFASRADPSYNDMFLRLQDGFISLYRADSQDKVWTDTDNASVPLSTTAVEILSITIDGVPVTPNNGSYTLGFSVSNTSNQNVALDTIVKAGGTEVGRQNTVIPSNYSGKIIMLSGVVVSQIDIGTVVTVEFEAASNGNLTINGDDTLSTFEITEAGGLEVSSLSIEQLDTFDWTMLPDGNPHDEGKLYIGNNDTIKVSRG